MSGAWWLRVVLGVAGLAGCGPPRAIVVEHATRDLDCRRDEIRSEHLYSDHYEAFGCERRVLYRCTREVCESVSEPHDHEPGSRNALVLP